MFWGRAHDTAGIRLMVTVVYNGPSESCAGSQGRPFLPIFQADTLVPSEKRERRPEEPAHELGGPDGSRCHPCTPAPRPWLGQPISTFKLPPADRCPECLCLCFFCSSIRRALSPSPAQTSPCGVGLPRSAANWPCDAVKKRPPSLS